MNLIQNVNRINARNLTRTGGNNIMKTVVIYGQNHKGSTYHIARELAEKIGGDITEFFLPGDFSDFCLGCTNCFMTSETRCPHYQAINPITHAMDSADVIILASPVYVFHVTAPMKALLDHYGYRWMVHSPEKSMFTKQGVCISTAAGGGMKSTNKDMADSMFFWGIAKINKYGVAVAATKWRHVKDKKKKSIDKKTTAIAKKIVRRNGKVTPGIKTKCFFFVMHILQRKGLNPKDADYWHEKDWTGSKRPWKDK